LSYRKLIIENKKSIHKEINKKINNQLLDKIYKQEISANEKQREIDELKNIIRNNHSMSLVSNNFHNMTGYQTFSMNNEGIVNIDNDNHTNTLNQLRNTEKFDYATISDPKILPAMDIISEKEKNGGDENIFNNLLFNNIKHDNVINTKCIKISDSPINEKHDLVEISVIKQNTMTSSLSQQQFNGTIHTLNKSFSKIVENIFDEKLGVEKFSCDVEVKNLMSSGKKSKSVLFPSKSKPSKNKIESSNINNFTNIKFSPGKKLNGQRSKSMVMNIEDNKYEKAKEYSKAISSTRSKSKSISKNTQDNTGNTLIKITSTSNILNTSNSLLDKSCNTSLKSINLSKYNICDISTSNKEKIKESNVEYTKKLLNKYYNIVNKYNNKIDKEDNNHNTSSEIQPSKSKEKYSLKESKLNTTINTTKNLNVEKFINKKVLTPIISTRKSTTPSKRNTLPNK
jgi:hypothetical protein